MRKIAIIVTISFLISCKEREIKLKEVWISCGRLGETCLIDSVKFDIKEKKTITDFSKLKLYIDNKLVKQDIKKIQNSKKNVKIIYEYNFNSNLGLYSTEIKEIIKISDNDKKVESLRKTLKNRLFWNILPTNNLKFKKNNLEDSSLHINPDKFMPFQI